MKKQKKKISELVLLIHPLFDLIEVISNPIISKIEKRNARFLLGLWGKQLKNAALNPESLVVIVVPFAYIVDKSRSSWADKRLTRFLSFAQKQFSERLIMVERSIDIRKLRKEISARGFVFEKKALKGRSFGEYWLGCVANQTREMQKILPRGTKQIESLRGLSLKGTYRTKRKNLTAKPNPNKRKPM